MEKHKTGILVAARALCWRDRDDLNKARNDWKLYKEKYLICAQTAVLAYQGHKAEYPIGHEPLTDEERSQLLASIKD